MTLTASGEMSIGGSTATRSINLELARAAGATSDLNEAALRTLAGVPSGTISLSDFYGKSNSVAYSVLSTNTADLQFSDPGVSCVSPNGTIFLVVNSFNTTFKLVKISSTGVVLLSRSFPENTFAPKAVVADASDNLYIWSGANAAFCTLDKLDSNLAAVWRRRLTPSQGTISATCATISPAGTIFLGGSVFSEASTSLGFVASVAAAGTLNASKTYGSLTVDQQVYIGGIVVDSGGNVYVTGSCFTTDQGHLLYKLNTSLAVVASVHQTGFSAGSTGIGLGSDGLVYVAVSAGTTPASVGLRKYNTSLVHQASAFWSVTGGLNLLYPTLVAADASGGLYLHVTTSTGGTTVLKTTTALGAPTGRSLVYFNTVGAAYPSSATINPSSGQLTVAGIWRNSDNTALAYGCLDLPLDMSGTKTYGQVTYATKTVTTATPTLTAGTAPTATTVTVAISTQTVPTISNYTNFFTKYT